MASLNQDAAFWYQNNQFPSAIRCLTSQGNNDTNTPMGLRSRSRCPSD